VSKKEKIYLDIPTYFNIDFINFIQNTNEREDVAYKIKHVYGSISGLFSARESERLPNITSGNLTSHINELKEIGVDFFYAFNTSCLGSLEYNSVKKIIDIIDELNKLNVRNFIIAHPLLIELIREQIKDAKFKISVISEIDDIRRFKHFINKRKVSMVNLSTSINRDFQFLERISKKRSNIVLLCNEACLFMCPYRASHYTIESHREKTHFPYSDYPLDKCYELLTDDEILRARFILPEWLSIYKEYAKFFKISGRTFPVDFIKKVTTCYATGKSPKNILELFPIVVSSVSNEQIGVREERTLELSGREKTKFLSHFRLFGHQCKIKCPCGHCNSYKKNVKRIKVRNDDF